MKSFSIKRRVWRDGIMLLIGALVVLGGILTINYMKHNQLPLKPQQPVSITIPWLPDTVKKWNEPILDMAKKYNIDPNLIAIIITLESGGDAKATSEAGAQGLMQIMPPTAKDIAAKHLKQPRSSSDILDPRTNIEFGAAYLSYLRKEFGDASQGPSWDYTVELIAAGYNGGPGAAGKLYKGEGITDPQTVGYSRDAFNMWRERRTTTSPTYERWLERGGSRLIDKAKTEK